jgi:hypothetical protein
LHKVKSKSEMTKEKGEKDESNSSEEIGSDAD